MQANITFILFPENNFSQYKRKNYLQNLPNIPEGFLLLTNKAVINYLFPSFCITFYLTWIISFMNSCIIFALL